MANNEPKYAAIRYHALLNTWLDVIVLVPAEFEKPASECVYKALAIDYWDDTDDRYYSSGYFEYVRDELSLYNIPSSIVCLEQFDEDDALFENYINYINKSEDCKYIDVTWTDFFKNLEKTKKEIN